MNDSGVHSVENIGYDVEGERLILRIEMVTATLTFTASISTTDHEIASWAGAVADDSWVDLWSVWIEMQGFGPLTLSHYHPTKV